MKRPLLLPLVPLWAAGVAAKNRGFDSGARPVERLRDPVISVGSLSAGGAGKTPLVIALGKALRERGYAVDVLSRGYGRSAAKSALPVQPAGPAEAFGDEPLLIARAVDAPVYVAAHRAEAGMLAEREHYGSPAEQRVHLLDDGFQHRQLARTVDIVLLTTKEVGDTLLPAGDLREPLRSLHRADILVLRREEASVLQPPLHRMFKDRPMPEVWTIERRFRCAEGVPSLHPLAFCGLARPHGFLVSLRWHGVVPADFVRLRDHQRYSERVIRRLISRAKASGADGMVTTAKDAVKLDPKLRHMLSEVGPLAICDISVEIVDEEQRIADLMTMVEARRYGNTAR